MPAYRAYLLLGFGSAFAIGLLDPIVAVYYVRVVGLGPLELILLGTVVEATKLIFEIPTGIVADLYSRRLSVLIGLFLVGGCFVIQGLWPVLGAIVVAEAMRGLGATFSSGALEAWIADEVGEDAAATAYVRNAQVRQIGALVGTVVGVGLASVALQIPIIAGGVGMLGMGVLMLIVMPERGFKRGHHAGLSPIRGAISTFQTGLREVRAKAVLGTLLMLWVFFALSTEGIDRLWEAHLLHYFTFPAIGGLDSVVWFGAINVAFMLLSVVANEAVRRWVDVRNDRAVAIALVVIVLVRIVSVAGFGLAVSFEMAVAAYVTTEVFRRTTGPLFTGWVNRHVDSRVRATVLSMGGQIDAVGQLSGGPIIGLVAELASLRAAMVAVGVTLLPAIPLLARGRRQSSER